jgi:hypothetical protein
LLFAAQNGKLHFTFDVCRLTYRPAGEKFREVMQTYIKKCGGKQVLTGLWKNLRLCLKKKKRNKSVALFLFRIY